MAVTTSIGFATGGDDCNLSGSRGGGGIGRAAVAANGDRRAGVGDVTAGTAAVVVGGVRGAGVARTLASGAGVGERMGVGNSHSSEVSLGILSMRRSVLRSGLLIRAMRSAFASASVAAEIEAHSEASP